MNLPKLILSIIWVGHLSLIVYYRFAYGAEMPEAEPLNIIFVILVSCLLIGSLTSRSLSITEARETLGLFCWRVCPSRRSYVAWCLTDSILSGNGISYVLCLHGD